jgi:hypothetical protein
MDQKCGIVIINEGNPAVTVCLFQFSEKWKDEGVVPVAWMCQRSSPGSEIAFNWTNELGCACKITVEHRSLRSAASSSSVFIHQPADARNNGKKRFTLEYEPPDDIKLTADAPLPEEDGAPAIRLRTGLILPSGDITAGLSIQKSFICRIKARIQPNYNSYVFDTDMKFGLLAGNYRDGDPLDESVIKDVQLFDMNNSTDKIFTICANVFTEQV